MATRLLTRTSALREEEGQLDLQESCSVAPCSAHGGAISLTALLEYLPSMVPCLS